jgi:hypothetical protein
MFWSSKKPTREEEKEKHIKGLQHAFPSMRRPNNDNELFEVRFVVDGQFSSLRILVNGEFPNTPPGIIIGIYHDGILILIYLITSDPSTRSSQSFLVRSSKICHWITEGSLKNLFYCLMFKY